MVVYNEKQRLNAVALIITIIVLLGILIIREPNVLKDSSLWITALKASSVSTIIIAVTMGIIYAIRLDSKIDKNGIHYRWYPIQIKYVTLPWQSIQYCYIRHVKPLNESGGGGYRYLSKLEVAFLLKGRKGLQLQLHENGKKILIGTQNPEEVMETIIQLKSAGHLPDQIVLNPPA